MSHRILVVEDEPAVADAITYALETEGFQAVWTPTGGEARSVLEKEEIHLVILDVGLPDCNGFELCREIRTHSRVPVIFLTARADEIDRVVGLEIGGDDYVVKPFSPRELTARVKAVLRRISSQGEEPSEENDLVFSVDERKKSISYHRTPLELSRYEYRLLKTLVDHPGWVFSREKLKSLVWEDPHASMDRTVDAHIKMVRAKLREIRPEENPIRTHRGQGYSLGTGP